MKFLDKVLNESEEYRDLYRAVELGRMPAMATGLSAVHKAHIIHSLCKQSSRKALVLAADEAEAQKICEDLEKMGTSNVFYPSRDFTFREVEGVSREFEHQRIGALYAFQNNRCDVIVTCVDAALQYTIPPENLKKTSIVVRTGTEISLETMVR